MSSGLLDTALKSTSELKSQVVEEAYRILAQIQDEVTQLNRDQLLEGKDSKGQKLTPKYRNKRYERAKNIINPKPGLGTPDLKFKGDFQKSFYLIPKKDKKVSFKVFASDDKTEKLVGRYGEAIFGLSVDNEGKINQIVLERLFHWIIMNLKI